MPVSFIVHVTSVPVMRATWKRGYLHVRNSEYSDTVDLPLARDLTWPEKSI